MGCMGVAGSEESMRRLLVIYIVAVFLVLGSCGRMQAADRAASSPPVKKDVPYVPTPKEVVEGLRALRAQLVLGLEPRRSAIRSPSSST